MSKDCLLHFKYIFNQFLVVFCQPKCNEKYNYRGRSHALTSTSTLLISRPYLQVINNVHNPQIAKANRGLPPPSHTLETNPTCNNNTDTKSNISFS